MMTSVKEELLSFHCLHFNDFSIFSYTLGSNEWNLIKQILSIYDHSVAMHLKFCQGVISYIGVIVLCVPTCY